MEVDDELTEMLARLARARGEDVVVVKKRGPKKRYGPREEVHLKFSAEVMSFINKRSPQGYQAYFDELVKRDMQ